MQFHQFAAKGFLEKTGLVPLLAAFAHYLTTQQQKKPGGLKPDMSCLALAKTMAALKKNGAQDISWRAFRRPSFGWFILGSTTLEWENGYMFFMFVSIN